MAKESCRICGHVAEENIEGALRHVNCCCCGDYTLTPLALLRFSPKEEKALSFEEMRKLSIAVWAEYDKTKTRVYLVPTKIDKLVGRPGKTPRVDTGR